jgi:hypothetical protein
MGVEIVLGSVEKRRNSSLTLPHSSGARNRNQGERETRKANEARELFQTFSRVSSISRVSRSLFLA